MRTLAVVLAACAIAAPAFAEEYTVLAVSKGPDAGIVLVETASVDRAAAPPTAWFLSIFDKAGDSASKDVAERYRAEADCAGRRIRFNELTTFDAEGHATATTRTPSEWRVQTAESVGGSMLALLCDEEVDPYGAVEGSVAELITVFGPAPAPTIVGPIHIASAARIAASPSR